MSGPQAERGKSNVCVDSTQSHHGLDLPIELEGPLRGSRMRDLAIIRSGGDGAAYLVGIHPSAENAECLPLLLRNGAMVRLTKD
jgi:hypothetical protein